MRNVQVPAAVTCLLTEARFYSLSSFPVVPGVTSLTMLAPKPWGTQGSGPAMPAFWSPLHRIVLRVLLTHRHNPAYLLVRYLPQQRTSSGREPVVSFIPTTYKYAWHTVGTQEMHRQIASCLPRQGEEGVNLTATLTRIHKCVCIFTQCTPPHVCTYSLSHTRRTRAHAPVCHMCQVGEIFRIKRLLLKPGQQNSLTLAGADSVFAFSAAALVLGPGISEHTGLGKHSEAGLVTAAPPPCWSDLCKPPPLVTRPLTVCALGWWHAPTQTLPTSGD